MQLESRFDSGTGDTGDWRSDSAASLHGDGRGFESLIPYLDGYGFPPFLERFTPFRPERKHAIIKA